MPCAHPRAASRSAFWMDRGPRQESEVNLVPTGRTVTEFPVWQAPMTQGFCLYDHGRFQNKKPHRWTQQRAVWETRDGSGPGGRDQTVSCITKIFNFLACHVPARIPARILKSKSCENPKESVTQDAFISSHRWKMPPTECAMDTP